MCPSGVMVLSEVVAWTLHDGFRGQIVIRCVWRGLGLNQIYEINQPPFSECGLCQVDNLCVRPGSWFSPKSSHGRFMMAFGGRSSSDVFGEV